MRESKKIVNDVKKCVICRTSYKTKAAYKQCMMKCSKNYGIKLLWCRWHPSCIYGVKCAGGQQSLLYHYEAHCAWENHWCKKCEKYVHNSKVCAKKTKTNKKKTDKKKKTNKKIKTKRRKKKN